MSSELVTVPNLSDINGPVIEMVQFFNSNKANILNTIAPLREKKRSFSKRSPWMTDAVHEQKRSCIAAERKWRKTTLEVHCNIYKEQVNIF